MVKALVFGKFLPFHKGHEAMIRFALTKCDYLTVLICCCDSEHILPEVRHKWISETFFDIKNIDIKCFLYSESDLPSTSEASREISKKWANKFKELYPTHSLIVTSEKYGDYVAEYMGTKHISFDEPRNAVPISATKIRNNITKNWNFLPNSTKKSFAIKIVLLGTESTGKSTLMKKLSDHYKCSYVNEAGRDVVSSSQTFKFDDLYTIANEHAKRIERAIIGDSRLIIIDTDIHITKSYANFIFNKNLVIDDGVMETNVADVYLYLNNDVPFIQDGTRLTESDRNLLDKSHRKIMADNDIKYHEITGDWDDRLIKSINIIDDYIKLTHND